MTFYTRRAGDGDFTFGVKGFLTPRGGKDNRGLPPSTEKLDRCVYRAHVDETCTFSWNLSKPSRF